MPRLNTPALQELLDGLPADVLLKQRNVLEELLNKEEELYKIAFFTVDARERIGGGRFVAAEDCWNHVKEVGIIASLTDQHKDFVVRVHRVYWELAQLPIYYDGRQFIGFSRLRPFALVVADWRTEKQLAFDRLLQRLRIEIKTAFGL
jgi:hypothetical protein